VQPFGHSEIDAASEMLKAETVLVISAVQVYLSTAVQTFVLAVPSAAAAVHAVFVAFPLSAVPSAFAQLPS
jgi:hypothetical protein